MNSAARLGCTIRKGAFNGMQTRISR
jgi:hypothetical protein